MIFEASAVLVTKKMWPVRLMRVIYSPKRSSALFEVIRWCAVSSSHWLLDNSDFQRLQQKYGDEQQNLMQNSSYKLETIHEILVTIRNQQKLITELETLTKVEGLKNEAKEELKVAQTQLNNLIENKLIRILLPESENINEIQMDITAGVGGSEAMLFTKDLLDMYINYSMYRRWTSEIINYQKSEAGGARHCSLLVRGDQVYNMLKFESGVHRVQRVPQTEKSGRIHTSTATVAILPQPSEILVDINEKDLKVETKRASGAGGQHVNKTESAIRMTHMPSGLVVECQTNRSQIHNRAEAKQKLQMRLYQIKFEEQLNAMQASRKIQVGTSGRSEKIRTYNFLQDRITDHRINVNFHHLEGFMKGGEEFDRLIHNLKQESINEIILEAIQQKIQ